MKNWRAKCVAGLGGMLLLACGPVSAQSVRPIGPPGGDVQALVAVPGGTSGLYFGTPDGHIFGSVDGGAHWARLGRMGTGHDEVVTAILIDSRTTQTLYASSWSLHSSSGGGVFRSDNGGKDWKAVGLTGHAVRALAQPASEPNTLIAGAVDGVFKSNDSGSSWVRISPEKHEELRNFDSIALDPRHPDTIYAGTYHLAWKTNDGGKNWFSVQKGMVSDSDVMSISIDPGNPDHVFSSACSGIYHSPDGGANWTKFKGIPSTSRRTVQIKQDPQHPEIVYAATTEGLWRTLDDGASWRPITPINWSILSMLIDPANPKRLVLGTERMGVEISEDGGATYHSSNDGFSHRRIADLAMDPAQPEHALVVLTNAIEPVLETRDGGRNWTPVASAKKIGPLRSVFAAPNGWWGALLKGGLVHYAGGSWVPAEQVVEKTVPAKLVKEPVKNGSKASAKTSRPAPQVVLTKSMIASQVHDMVFVRSGWYAASDNGVLLSHDSGASWVLISPGMSNAAVLSVGASAGNSNVWAVTRSSIFTSNDAGKNWATQPLPFEARGSVRFHATDSSNFLLASDHGLFESHDGGQSWKQNGLPELMIVDFAQAGDSLVVSTRSGNLYVSSDEGKSWSLLGHSTDSDGFPALRSLGDSQNVLAASGTEGLYMLNLGTPQRAALDKSALQNR